jgi:hypothetical protein
MKFNVFWDVVPCNHVEVYRRFGDAYSIIREFIALMIKALGITETSVNFNVTTTALHPRRL